MMEQKRDIEILAKSSVKPYMDSDFGGPFKEGVTVVEHLRALDLEGDSFFLVVPAAQTCHTRIAAGDRFCYPCREYFPINKTGGSLMTLEQQVCNLLSDVQLNLSDKPWLVPIEMEIKCFKDMEPDGTISCPNVEIQTVKFIQDYLHFDLKSPACELCPHSYVILAGLMRGKINLPSNVTS